MTEPRQLAKELEALGLIRAEGRSAVRGFGQAYENPLSFGLHSSYKECAPITVRSYSLGPDADLERD